MSEQKNVGQEQAAAACTHQSKLAVVQVFSAQEQTSEPKEEEVVRTQLRQTEKCDTKKGLSGAAGLHARVQVILSTFLPS